MIVPPLTGEDTDHRRRLAAAIGSLINGHGNNVGSLTVASTDTSTAVTDARVSVDSVIVLMPTNAAAATEYGAGTLYVSARDAGTFTVTTTNAAASRTFDYAIIGTGHTQ